MKVYNYTAVIEWDEEAQRYWGYFPAVPGAHTEGATLDEMRAHLREVLELVLEDREETAPERRDVLTERISVSV